MEDVIPKRYHRLKQVLNRRQPDLTVLTEDVHKPHNLSAIIRTCDAVGIFEVHSVNVKAELPTFSQVSQGSEKWIFLNTHPDTRTAISYLKNQKFRVYAAHFSSKSLDYRQIDYTKPSAIIFGAEKWGVTKEAAQLADEHIVIPMLGMVQSLNVSVAAAVILFEAQRQRLAANIYDNTRLESEIYDQVLFEWGYAEIARVCREQGISYPILGENGEIKEGFSK
ncbi:tRNA (guanosine(18)-2'-O)-methyltransferase TrmH [cyanobacterium endosymbiont of Epithemia turgida]|uniref:tRNA (guanosine(18)-2'-O)-methyltransferase TrmH n=1 Tax=cyanobacterium endosymbiont of Epithemia turgida TaxID=718217 RepID=UPI0004D14E22|nr:tRNA (guanosine(18)-2'-O)-methyltransferase TrmH [cyanobacterium endosymbiont of Epithemia turgida]BAP17741.1 putative tRNA (guanosine-2'-O-)-methyltransferase [cyanobacterium endosymbiont of Epithemia turgida isolate EtSB Lake Yunoko]